MESEDELSEISAEWKIARKKYLENKILFEIAMSEIHDMNTKLNNGSDFSDCVYNSMIISMCSSIGKFTKITDAHTGEFQSNPTDIINSSTKFIICMAKKLQENCEDIYKLCLHDNMETVSKSLMSAKMLQLGNIVEEKVKDLHNFQKSVNDLLKRKKHLLDQSLVQLNKNTVFLKLILEKYLIKLKPEKDIIACKSLVAKTESLMLKIETNIVTTKLENYTADKIQACKLTIARLDEDILNKTKRAVTLEEQLTSYQLLGDEYQQIVKEYSSFQATINNKDMVLKSLTNKNN